MDIAELHTRLKQVFGSNTTYFHVDVLTTTSTV